MTPLVVETETPERTVLHTDKTTYMMGKVLGAGSFGEIRQAIDADGHRLVIKRVNMQRDLEEAESPEARQAVLDKHLGESDAMRLANASIQPLDIATVGDELFIVLRQLRVGLDDKALKVKLDAQPMLRRQLAHTMLHDVSAELGRVHAAGWVHRDIKLENCMLDRRGKVVLIDFGEAKELDPENRNVVVPDCDDANPEMFARETFLHWDEDFERIDTPASEVFAAGLCWSMLATGRDTHPFDNMPDVHEAWGEFHGQLPLDAAGQIDVGVLQERSATGPDASLREFVTRLCQVDLRIGSYVATQVLHPDPTERPTGAQVAEKMTAQIDDLRGIRKALKEPLPKEDALKEQADQLARDFREQVKI